MTSRKVKKFQKNLFKILIWGAIIFVVYYFYTPLKFQAIRLLQLNPTVWSIYLTISHEIVAATLLGLFLTAFFGSLFFVSIPVELVFIYYLSLDFTPWEVVLYVVLGNLAGMVFNYMVGFVLGPKIMEKWLKKKYYVWQKRTERAGGFVLIFGNIVPFPIELVTLFIGGVRYNFFKFFIYTFLGKMIKFGLLFVGYTYFSESLTGWWDDVMFPWIMYMYESYISPVLGLF